MQQYSIQNNISRITKHCSSCNLWWGGNLGGKLKSCNQKRVTSSSCTHIATSNATILSAGRPTRLSRRLVLSISERILAIPAEACADQTLTLRATFGRGEALLGRGMGLQETMRGSFCSCNFEVHSWEGRIVRGCDRNIMHSAFRQVLEFCSRALHYE